MSKMGFGKNANSQGVFASRGGMGGRMRGAGSSALIGGAFPFLFGQGLSLIHISEPTRQADL